jgi:hypothetical protein
MEKISAFPYEAELAMDRKLHNDKELNYPERLASRTKDIFSMPGRAAMGAFGDEGFQEGFSRKESEGAETLGGTIGMGILRDPFLIPSTLVGAPIGKAVAKGVTATASIPSNMARNAVIAGRRVSKPLYNTMSAVPKVYNTTRGFITGGAEGAIEGAARLVDAGITDGDYGTGSILTDMGLGAGMGAGMGAASQLVGDWLTGSGLKKLEKKVKKKHFKKGLTPSDKLEEALGRFGVDKITAANDWDAEVLEGIKSGLIISDKQGGFMYTDGSAVVPPASVYSLKPSTVPYGVSQVEKIQAPDKMADELQQQISGIGDRRVDILEGAPAVTKDQREEIFTGVTESLEKLLEKGELTASEYDRALNTLKQIDTDYPLYSMRTGYGDAEGGLHPLLQVRKRMDRKYKPGSVKVDDSGKIRSYNSTGDFVPGTLTRQLFRDELNDVIGNLSPRSRKLDLEELSPRIKVRDAFKDITPSEYSFRDRFTNPDKDGTKRLRLGQAISPKLADGSPHETHLIGDDRGIDLIDEGKLTPRGKARTASTLGLASRAGARSGGRKAATEVEKRWRAYIEEQKRKGKTPLAGN